MFTDTFNIYKVLSLCVFSLLTVRDNGRAFAAVNGWTACGGKKGKSPERIHKYCIWSHYINALIIWQCF